MHGGHYYDDEQAWRIFRIAIRQRLNWLAELPKRLREQASALEKVQTSALEEGRREIPRLDIRARAFIDPSRVEELKKLRSTKFDFSKLIRLCEELNAAFASGSYFAVAMLVARSSIMCRRSSAKAHLAEVANNYAGTSRSKDRCKRSIARCETLLTNICIHRYDSSD